MRIQCASAPRGAATVPTPLHSLGQVDGSHLSTLAVVRSPALMLPTSSLKSSTIISAQYCASRQRASVRPIVVGSNCLALYCVSGNPSALGIALLIICAEKSTCSCTRLL